MASLGIYPAHQLPTKVYTMLVPKFEKHPIFADFLMKKNQPFFNWKLLILRPNKTPVSFKQSMFFLLYIWLSTHFCESENNCIQLKTFFYVGLFFITFNVWLKLKYMYN